MDVEKIRHAFLSAEGFEEATKNFNLVLGSGDLELLRDYVFSCTHRDTTEGKPNRDNLGMQFGSYVGNLSFDVPGPADLGRCAIERAMDLNKRFGLEDDHQKGVIFVIPGSVLDNGSMITFEEGQGHFSVFFYDPEANKAPEELTFENFKAMLEEPPSN